MPSPLLSKKGKAVFLTILAGVLWGTSFPIIKIGLATIDPYAFVFWRFLFSTVILFAVMLVLGKLDFRITNKKLIVFLGIVNAAGYLLQYVGMPYTTSAKAALFINLSAIWVAILSPRLLGETFSRKKIIGVFFGLGGIIFVSTNLDFSTMTQGQLLADLMLIIAGVSWALFILYNKKMVTRSTTETFQFMTWVLLFTLLTIVPFTVLSGPGFFALSAWAWVAIVYQAVVCWVIPYYLWLEGLKYLSASTSTILLLSEIVVAVIASVILLKEPVTVFSTVGALFIILAIALVSLKDNNSRQALRNQPFP
ncbi:MAG: DMT family transporter [Candidatus Bathyarchaeota archaeon]|nr:DMT family transporter [Candidatus Bathyarchaeota archaeon]